VVGSKAYAVFAQPDIKKVQSLFPQDKNAPGRNGI
jgi:hypothetical protein